MGPRKCEKTAIEELQKIACAMVGHRLYAPVDVVVSDKDDKAGTLTFSATTTAGSRGSYVVRWGDIDDMWAPCPSSLPSAATPDEAGPAPDPGANGTLYLSGDYLAKTDISAMTPKWPRSLTRAVGYDEPLRVWPVSLKLTAVELANSEYFDATIDLLDPRLCAPGQKITLDRHALTLHLTQRAFAEFGVRFQAFDKLESAVDEIEAKRDPDAIAAAWEVVAGCIRELPRVQNTEHASHYLEQIRRVLPDASL